MALSNEQLLVKGLKDGNHLAFDSLFNLYFDNLFRFAYSILKNKEDAEEIVQEVFVKVWEKRNNIKLYYSFKSFLFSITYNMVISFLRKRQKDEKHFSEYLQKIPEQTQEPADIQLIYNEQLEKIEQIINKMPFMRKKIFRMSRYEGLSYHEIAVRLGISKNTVENQISAALKFLRQETNDKGMAILLAYFLFFR